MKRNVNYGSEQGLTSKKDFKETFDENQKLYKIDFIEILQIWKH